MGTVTIPEKRTLPPTTINRTIRRFYLYRLFHLAVLQQQDMDHASCLSIACRKNDPKVFTKDVEAWRDTAKHGDKFEISPIEGIIVLDL